MIEATAGLLRDVCSILSESRLPSEEIKEIMQTTIDHVYETDQIDEIERVSLLGALDCPICYGAMLLSGSTWECRDCGHRREER